MMMITMTTTTTMLMMTKMIVTTMLMMTWTHYRRSQLEELVALRRSLLRARRRLCGHAYADERTALRVAHLSLGWRVTHRHTPSHTVTHRYTTVSLGWHRDAPRPRHTPYTDSAVHSDSQSVRYSESFRGDGRTAR